MVVCCSANSWYLLCLLNSVEAGWRRRLNSTSSRTPNGPEEVFGFYSGLLQQNTAQVSEARQGKYTDTSAVLPGKTSQMDISWDCWDWIEDNPTPLTMLLLTHPQHSKTFNNQLSLSDQQRQGKGQEEEMKLVKLKEQWWRKNKVQLSRFVLTQHSPWEGGEWYASQGWIEIFIWGSHRWVTFLGYWPVFTHSCDPRR